MPKESKYKKLDEETYYETPKGRGVVRVSENKETEDKTISFSSEVKTSDGKWVQRRGKFFAIPFAKGTKFIDILLKFASKFGIRVSKQIEVSDEIKNLKEKLDEALRQKQNVEDIKNKLEMDIKSHLENIEKLRQQVVEKNLPEFAKSLQEFERKLSGAQKEEELQEFLKNNPWIFGPEYVDSKPKKPVGSKSIFDFYLEDYKGQGTVVELEKSSDSIFSKKESLGISPKCGESIGQLIRYTEDTISYSSNRKVSEKEGINEDKPLGFLIIGRTKTKEEIQGLKVINSYLHSIQILSYDLLLLKAKRMLEGYNKFENETKNKV